MSKEIVVCQVVNKVSETSIPANIAVSLHKYTGIKSKILAIYDNEGFHGDHLIEVDCLGASTRFFDVSAYRCAMKKLEDVDIIQTHHNRAGIYAKMIAKHCKKKLIRTEQNTHNGYRWISKVANGLTNPMADKITCITNSVYESFEWWEELLVDRKKIEVINNGIDLKYIKENESEWNLIKETSVKEESIVIGNAASLTRQKAHRTLIKSIYQVNKRSKRPVELTIAGKGKLEKKLAKMSKKLGIKNKIHFLGLLNRREVYKMMEQADIFCMPSRWEGFCVAVAEAMGLGTPCIISDIPVFRELYDKAAVFHPVDDSKKLANKILKLSKNGKLRKKLSRKSIRMAKSKFSIKKVAKKYEELYHQICEDVKNIN